MITNQLEPIKEQTIVDGDQTYVIRSIDDLMRLTSYSDMSDLEIEKLTNFKVAQAKVEAEAAANKRVNDAFQEVLRQQTATALTAAQAAYAEALAAKPSLTIMAPEEVANVMEEPVDEP